MILPVFISLSLYLIVSARTVTLSNTRLPLDTSGSPLKTGEASFLFAQGVYWAYLNNWGGCKGVDCCPSPSGCASCCFHDGYAPDPCVYTNNHSVVVYSTPDFKTSKTGTFRARRCPPLLVAPESSSGHRLSSTNRTTSCGTRIAGTRR